MQYAFSSDGRITCPAAKPCPVAKRSRLPPELGAGANKTMTAFSRPLYGWAGVTNLIQLRIECCGSVNWKLGTSFRGTEPPPF